jgi:hypothetical protein
MAFKVHSGISKIFANKMSEPVTGFFMGAYQDTVPNQFGNHNLLLKMKSKDGSDFEVVTVGTLGYVAKNVLMAAGQMEKNPAAKDDTIAKDAGLVGKFIQITPAGTYLNKAKKEIKKFVIEVDDDIKFQEGQVSTEEIPF